MGRHTVSLTGRRYYHLAFDEWQLSPTHLRLSSDTLLGSEARRAVNVQNYTILPGTLSGVGARVCYALLPTAILWAWVRIAQPVAEGTPS